MGSGGDILGSVAGAVVGIAAAPFTGGASLGLMAAGGAMVGGSIGSAYNSHRMQKKAAAAQNRAYQVQARQAALQNSRATLQQIRASRIARAQQVNQAAAIGGVESSGAMGAASSVGAQTTSNLNYMYNQWQNMNAIQDYTNLSNRYSTKAQTYQNRWATVQQVMQLGMQGYGAYQNAQTLQSLKATTGASQVPQQTYNYSGINYSI